MKTLTIAALAGIASFGLWTVAAHETPTIDPVISNSVPVRTAARSYTVSNVTASTACLVERGGRLSSRSESFAAGADCETVWPGLSRAHTWIDNGDGTVVLADTQGEDILTIVESDGLAYETVEPADALLTMVVAD